MDMTKVETLIEKATDLLDAGFATKAAQKEALQICQRAYELVRHSMQGAYLDRPMEERHADALATDLYYAAHNLHEFTAARFEQARKVFPGSMVEELATIERLQALRDAIKAAAITPIAKRQVNETEKRVVSYLRSLHESRMQQYLDGVNLSEVIGGVNAYARSHYVNYGTSQQFIRAMYFLNGRRTALNVIIAVAEEFSRRHPNGVAA